MLPSPARHYIWKLENGNRKVETRKSKLAIRKKAVMLSGETSLHAVTACQAQKATKGGLRPSADGLGMTVGPNFGIEAENRKTNRGEGSTLSFFEFRFSS